MFEALKSWRDEMAGVIHDGTGALPADLDNERRESERFWFAGAEVFLFLPGEQCFRLRLKDVSCTGLSGLTDAPVSVGELVMVQFEETLMPAATITWTRSANVGMEMVNALPPARLRRIWDRHEAGAAWSPAMRAGSDLGHWWTDVGEVESGRRPARAEELPKKPRRKR